MNNSSSTGLLIWVGFLLLSQCTYYGAMEVKRGLDNVAAAIDRGN